jgi:Fuc2NAc and GlcNAc transferase
LLFISCTLVLSLITGWLLVAMVRSVLLKRGLLDLPNARSSHVRPTPRGGGIAIVTLTLVGVLIAWGAGGMSGALALGWAIGGGLVALVGWLDDVGGLSPSVRAGTHLLAAGLLLHAVDFGAIQSLAGLPPAGLIVAGLLIGVAVVWSINLFNFMDGIDGLAAAQCVFVAAAGTLLTGTTGAIMSSLPLLVLGGAGAGFLLWNRPPARIFMGDVGSGFVGFALAAGALTSSHHGLIDPWTWLVLDSLFAADATVTLITRLLRGQRIYEAHRLHVYQRLARRWGSHGHVTALYSGINLLWCLPWAIATTRSSALAPVLALAEFAILCLAMIAVGGGRAEKSRSMEPRDIKSG